MKAEDFKTPFDKIKDRPLRIEDLLKAAELTGGDRNRDYGDPVENYRDTVRIFQALTSIELTPHEGAMFMVAVKLARLKTSPLKDDNYIDAMAYLGIAHECASAPEGSTGP